MLRNDRSDSQQPKEKGSSLNTLKGRWLPRISLHGSRLREVLPRRRRYVFTSLIFGFSLLMFTYFIFRQPLDMECGRAGFEAAFGIRVDAGRGQPFEFIFPIYEYPPPI
ncbi:unnamed protein product [Hymenolepis diminuta]|uniref:PHB domain-containing protein n=1 Tax=Hymenolepis diminuta TaxID=6216 RepID=A0A0R3SSJ3_HYMDI|nr:unnamed protein product [Hymenolepis diminuta]